MVQDCRKSVTTRRIGATAVEFAIVAPILVLLVFGIIEIGRAVMSQHSMEDAVRVGCRLAIMDGTTTSDVTTTVIDELAVAGITVTPNMVDVTPNPPTNACLWDDVNVSVTIPYSDLSWIPVPTYLGNVNLSASCTLPREGNPCN